MDELKGYDVLKLMEHSGKCYVSTDYVKGKPLIRWLKYHPDIAKQQLYAWMKELIHQVECFHRCNGNPCYQYLNPYSIIVTEEEKLYLLDLGSRSQEELLRWMQKRSIRENFLASDNVFYQRASVEDDIFGLGKTLQYMLATTYPAPAHTWREEFRLQKIISRCLGEHSRKRYRSIREILNHFPV